MTSIETELRPVAAAGDESPVDIGSAETQTERHEFSLPPVDHGKDAWFFLAACFMSEALVWGFPFAFGVFQNYYSTHEPFAGSANIAIIGTCAMVSESPVSLSLSLPFLLLPTHTHTHT